MNQQLEHLRQSATVGLHDRVVAARAAGQRIYPLHVGDPDFPTPSAVIQVAIQALQDGWTHYVPSQGLPELRQAIVHALRRDLGVDYDPEQEILVTHGGIHACYVALQILLNPGDEVLIPDPDWATHASLVTLLRGRAVRVPALPEDNFLPSFEAWQQALTERTKALVINYPSNPTGTYPSFEYLQRLHEFAATHGLWVVSDEVYHNLYYEEPPVSAAAIPGAREHTLLVNSLSKTYAMTGWRVGYLAAPAAVIRSAIKVGQYSITCVAPFVQKAAAFALTDPLVQQAAADMRAAYAQRRQRVLTLAREHPSAAIRVYPPRGTFYFFLDLRALNMPSQEIADRLLQETGVAVVPGAAFGQQGEGFLRLSIAAAEGEIEAGFRLLLEWCQRQLKQ